MLTWAIPRRGANTRTTTRWPTGGSTMPATLDEAVRKRDVGAFFGSLHGTLNHLLLGDRIWMARFDGSTYPSTGLDAILFEAFEALRTAREEMDARIEAFFAAPPPGFWDRPIRYVNNEGRVFE